jgi:protein tyrosine phosphatase (PTP) superfamily phosphohydrolase (DUF442 family)
MRISPSLLLTVLLIGCQGRTPSENVETESTIEDGPIQKKGLHNVYRITDNLFSGSSPEGDDGFQSLKELGVRTILSVDGARPDVERAQKFGLRYVHLPFGYDGIPRQRVLELAKAVRDLPGPVYLHCHHGKHRGPAAAAVIHLCLDEKCSIAQAVAEMKRAGTDPRYTGLFNLPHTLVRPTSKELDAIGNEFPEVAKVPDLAQIMVEIDARWENLKLIRAAGWKSPRNHPDLDPAHEGLQLMEQYREAGRLKKGPEEMRRWLADAEGGAEELVRWLRGNDAPAAEKAFQSLGTSCVRCHAKYRDVPQLDPGLSP